MDTIPTGLDTKDALLWLLALVITRLLASWTKKQDLARRREELEIARLEEELEGKAPRPSSRRRVWWRSSAKRSSGSSSSEDSSRSS